MMVTVGVVAAAETGYPMYPVEIFKKSSSSRNNTSGVSTWK